MRLSAPARLTKTNHWRYNQHVDIRQLLDDGMIVVHHPRVTGKAATYSRLDWAGREAAIITTLPSPVSFRIEARSPDERIIASFSTDARTATLITLNSHHVISRVTFPIGLLHPPAHFDIAERYDVAVDEAGRVMIACPNAPVVSLVAVQHGTVVAMGRCNGSLPKPKQYEGFYAQLTSDGSALVNTVTDAAATRYEYHRIEHTGQRLTTTLLWTGARDSFDPAGAGDCMIGSDYQQDDGWIVRTVLTATHRDTPAYAGMRLLNSQRVAGGWIAIRGSTTAFVRIQHVVSGDHWQFRCTTPAPRVYLTPDGRYALCVEPVAETPVVTLTKRCWSLAPWHKKPILLPEVRISIFERPGRLRASAYSRYGAYPAPTASWAFGTDYHLSPDGRTVVVNCEKHGATVFSW